MDDVVIDLDELTAKLIASMNIDGLIERAWKAERERDEARAALTALVAGLGLDDTPRRAAIDAARALVKSWEAT